MLQYYFMELQPQTTTIPYFCDFQVQEVLEYTIFFHTESNKTNSRNFRSAYATD